MNPDFPIDPRSALESSLTALLLGELPHEEAAALHQKLAQDPELAALYERLKHTINLVRETVSNPAQETADQPSPLKLSEERRQKLLQQFKTVAPREFARPRRRAMPWLVPVGLAAAFLLILGAITLPTLSRRSGAPSLGFHSWSLRDTISPPQSQLAAATKSRDEGRSENELSERFLRRPPATPPPAPVPSAGTAIVLPGGGEPDALASSSASTFRRRFGQQTEPAPASFGDRSYDDAVRPSGDVGRGVTTVGADIKPPTDAQIARGRRTEVADSASFFSTWQTAGALEVGRSFQNDGRIQALGETAPAAVAGRSGSSADLDSLFASGATPATSPATSVTPLPNSLNKQISQQVTPLTTERSSLALTPSPAAEPAAASAPAQVSSSAAVNDIALPVPALTPATGTQAGSLEVAGVPLETHSEVLSGVPVYSRSKEPNRPSAEPMKGAELLKERAVAEVPAVAPPPAQESAVNEAHDRQSNAAIAAKPSEASRADNKALGFDRYLGNQLVNGAQIKAQGGTAPPVAGQPLPEVKTYNKSPADVQLAWSDTHFGLFAEQKPAKEPAPQFTHVSHGNGVLSGTQKPAKEPAPQFTLQGITPPNNSLVATTGGSEAEPRLNFDTRPMLGLPSADGGQVPVLGDVPTAGRRFYRLNGDEVGGGGKVKAEEKVESVSSIALPSAPGETTLALAASGADQKSAQYFAAKREVEEAQRFRQILNMKIAGEGIDASLPKTTMVEIVDKAAAQPAQKPSLGDRIRGAFGGKVERSARVKVERDQSDVSGFADRGKTAIYDPYFIQTEFELMQSEPVLGKVVDKLNLKAEWANKQGGGTLTKEEALARLKKSLDLKPVPNTSLIDVGVKSDSPDEAARIANAVAEAYRDQRLDQRKVAALSGAKALAEQNAKLSQKIASLKQEAERLQKAAKPSASPGSDVSPAKPPIPAPIPQPEVQTSENAFSTFSLNVSDVSFKLAAASLEKGVMPEPASVRSEEFINAFDYRDPEPPPGVPVAFAWERAQYPFAQNRDLLRFSIKTAAQGRQPGRPMNIVLLLDTSGSMERADRVQIIREALRVLAAQLQSQDKFSVVTFARTARLWVDGVPGNQAAQVVEEVSGITPQGGTNLEDAMNLAYQTAQRHYLASGINRVVLLTDGAANLGDVAPEALKQKVEANRKQGIALDCFGIGWEGYNDDLLEVLSRDGDGRYGFINTPEETATGFAAQLAGALQVAASDVKVQVEFNPARVTAYRQIGYAKHQLTKEQFRDNTVAAAQIGAAESGNALYVVDVSPTGTGPLATVRVRYRVPGTNDVHEHEWPVPYTGNAVPLDQSSPAMRLAATASAFSEWLVSSPYATEVTPDRLLGYLNGIPEVYGADARPKKLEWMVRQAKSISGK